MHWGITQVTKNTDHNQDLFAQQDIIGNDSIGRNVTGKKARRTRNIRKCVTIALKSPHLSSSTIPSPNSRALAQLEVAKKWQLKS